MLNKRMAVRMIRAGMSLREIEEREGITRNEVHNLVVNRWRIKVLDLRPRKSKPRPIEALFDGFELWRQTGRERTRHLVRVRDGFKCQHPGCKFVWKKGMRMPDVHHTGDQCGKNSRGYDSTKDLSGMVTLCHFHHMRFHVDTDKMRGKKKLSDVSFSDLDELRWQGLSYQEIAKKFKVSYNAVYKKLKGITN